VRMILFNYYYYLLIGDSFPSYSLLAAIK
jgi:hypothetical protein